MVLNYILVGCPWVITASNQQIHLETSPIEEHGALTYKLQDPISYAWFQNWTSAQRKFDLKSHFQPDKLKRAFIWEKRWSLLPQSTALDPSPMHWFSHLDRVDTAERVKVFINGENVALLRGWTYHRKKLNRLTLLAEPTFCFLSKRFAKSCMEM